MIWWRKMRVRRRRQELGSKACMSGVEKGFMAQHRGNTTRLNNRSPSFRWLVTIGIEEVSISFLCSQNSSKYSTWSCSNGVSSCLCRRGPKRDSASHIISTKARTILSSKFPGTAKPDTRLHSYKGNSSR